MALTPLLNDLGCKAADFIGEKVDGSEDKAAEVANFDAADPVVILGFGQMSQVLVNFLSTPLASGMDGDAGWPFIAFDLDPAVVKGKISAEDIKNIAKELGEHFTDAEIQEMVEEADRDRDGEVSTDEFMRMMKRTSYGF